MIAESKMKPDVVETLGIFLRGREILIDSRGDVIENFVQYRCRWIEDQQKWEILPVVKVKNLS